MKSLPFRRRLTLWSVILTVIVMIVSGVGTALLMYRRAVAKLDEELREESGHFFSELAQHGGVSGFDWKETASELREWLPPETPPRLVEIHTPDGELQYRSKNLPDLGPEIRKSGFRDVRIGKKNMRVLATEQGGVKFLIATDLAVTKSLIKDLALALLAALPPALALAWFGGYWLAERAVQPVREIAAAAEAVTAEHLDRRVPVPPVSDEIQSLALVLNATFDRLERSYAQALRFSADASHELKTPLTVLRTSLEAVLESRSLGENDRAAVAGLLEQIQRLSSITTGLLLLARADAGRLILDAAEHDLTTLTGGCVEDARIFAESRAVKVECRLPQRAPARVDTLRFAQIASNLLDNAVKYNRPGGEVRVELADLGDTWRLSIANTGPGIAPEYGARLFERFFRAEHTAEETGQGLGLSLSRELARAHGGELTLLRSDEVWTEFAVTLPKAGPLPFHHPS